MTFENEIISDHEFLVRVESPVREQAASHQCVCLLIKGPPIRDPEAQEALERIAGASGVPPEIVRKMIESEDKCKRMVDSPDQAFCDNCEADGHHLLDNQIGLPNKKENG